MTVCRVIVVVGAVKICRHDRNIIGTVLLVEELAVLQTGYLGKGICLIGLFKLRCKQAAFLHRLRCHTGVNAGRTQKFKLLAAVLPCGMDNIHFKNHVLIHEISQCVLIGNDSAYLCSRKEYILRLFSRKEFLHLILSAKIKLLVRTCDYVGISLTYKLTVNG